MGNNHNGYKISSGFLLVELSSTKLWTIYETIGRTIDSLREALIKLHKRRTEICKVLRCMPRCTCNNSLVGNQFNLWKSGNLNNSRLG